MTKITFLPQFKKEFKRLSKKYQSLEADMKGLIKQLEEKPDLGTPLGGNVFKIRWQVKSKGKGKSGGVRGNHILCRGGRQTLPSKHL